MAEIFTSNFNEVSGGRWDCEYFLSDALEINTIFLNQIATIKGGKRIPKGKGYSSQITPYKYLRVDDIDIELSSVDVASLKSIDKDIFDLLSRYEIKNNEIALSNAGTIGKILYFLNSTENKVILTENCVKILPNSKVLPKFLIQVLKTDFLQKQLRQEYIQTTIPKLAIERIKKLKIPQIPPLATQQNIIDIMDKAYKNKKEKENKAKELLDSIDDYLLNELGIVLPKLENKDIKKRIFIRKFSELSCSRFDASYHQSYYKELEHALEKGAKYPVTFVKDIGLMNNGSLIADAFYIDKAKRAYIRIKDLSFNSNINLQSLVYINDDFKDSGETKVKENDIVFATIGATIGKLNLVPNALSGSFVSNNTSRFRLFNNFQNSAKFYEAVFQSSFFQLFIKRNITTTAQPKITNEDILNLKIPLPPLAMQEKIAKEITKRKAKALALQNEAKELLEQAKKEVEKIILGE